jgi:predicted RNA-binding protein (virulence factor B family)
MSKKSYKALIGNLFRAGRIRIDQDGIYLLEGASGD